MTPLWKQICLIGRDRLLQKEVIPVTLHPNRRFVLMGEAGVGKTAILECAAENSPRKSAVVNANTQNLIMLKQIAEAWGIEVESEGAKPKTAEYETAVLQCRGHALFIDGTVQTAPFPGFGRASQSLRCNAEHRSPQRRSWF